MKDKENNNTIDERVTFLEDYTNEYNLRLFELYLDLQLKIKYIDERLDDLQNSINDLCYDRFYDY